MFCFVSGHCYFRNLKESLAYLIVWMQGALGYLSNKEDEGPGKGTSSQSPICLDVPLMLHVQNLQDCIRLIPGYTTNICGLVVSREEIPRIRILRIATIVYRKAKTRYESLKRNMC